MGFGPRVGYGVSLSERWSFHPTLGVTYETLTADGVARDALTGDLFSPLLLHPAPRWSSAA